MGLKLRKSSTIMLIGALLVLIGFASWFIWSDRLPVHTIRQAVELGCSDYDTGDDGCHPFRIGGFVVPGSWANSTPRPGATFEITDGCLTLRVNYVGDPSTYESIRPRAFVVAQGSISVDGEFYSRAVYVNEKAARLGKRMHETDAAYVRGCQKEQQRRSGL